ncbi:MAG: transcription termination/antitermination factor NusG [Planctomycetota bacterium]|nr:MAG: transcription termination/antitermination factor NusG [Planctomycetota bacterium]
MSDDQVKPDAAQPGIDTGDRGEGPPRVERAEPAAAAEEVGRSPEGAAPAATADSASGAHPSSADASQPEPVEPATGASTSEPETDSEQIAAGTEPDNQPAEEGRAAAGSEEAELEQEPESARRTDEASLRAEREKVVEEALAAIEESESEEEQPELQWYVLKVQTNREKSIREALLKRIKREGMEKYFGEIIIPTERVKETRGGRTRNVERRLYPGYLMIQMALNDDTWYLVRDVGGVGDFTGAGGRPVPMKEEEIRAMLGREAEKETAPAKVKVSFSRGDMVKIKEGPFGGFEGTVEEIDYETGKITVLVDILGRTTPVQDLDYWQVERL